MSSSAHPQADEVQRIRVDLAAAYRLIHENVGRSGFEGELDGILVCQQIDGGKELVAGIQRDPEMGAVLMIGSGGVLRPHQKVVTRLGDGEITSGTFSPSLSRSIALARLPADIAVGETVDVEVRDKRLQARVVKPPFARNGEVLVE